MREIKYVEKCLPTAKQALNGMKMAKELFITKDGYFYNFAAESFINRLRKFEEYVVPELVDSWTKCIRGTIHLAGEKEDDFLIKTLESYEIAGVIMREMYLQPENYKNKIKQIYMHDEIVLYLILKYSLFALEFFEEFADKGSIHFNKILKEQYELAIQRENKAGL